MITARRGMTPQDLFRIQSLSDLDLAPDGCSAAFVVRQLDEAADAYRAAIWLVDVDGGCAPRRFTHGGTRDSAPRFSPDGRTLAFIRDQRDNQNRLARPQLWAIRLDGGEAWPLTDTANGAADPAWSPDGAALVFTARVTPEDGMSEAEKEQHRSRARVIERLRHKLNAEGFTYDRPPKLWCVPFAESGPQPATQLTHGDWSDTAPAWSPDGDRIAFVSARHQTRDRDAVTDIWVIPAGGGEPRCLTNGEGPAHSPAWSPDGRTLAFLGHQHPEGGWFNETLSSVPAGGAAAPVCLTRDFDHTLSGPLLWSEDGAAISFLAADEGAQHLYRVSARGGTPVSLLNGEQQVTDFAIHGDTAVYLATRATDPAELFAQTLTGEGRRVVHNLSDLNASWKAEVERPAPEPVWFASADGTRVQGWLLKPVGYREGERYPLLYNIHGGPHTQYGYAFHDDFQVQAGAGYGVAFINFRGSTGYGEHFAEMLAGQMGVLDYEDLIAGLDTIAALPWVDPARIGVLGGSYGGFMTSWLISHTDRFAAACSERAVNNWYSKVGSSDIGYMQYRQLGCAPWEDPLLYLQRSPIYHVQQITTPTLIIHSENDLRCPIEQGEQLFTALKYRGVETRFVRFPEENHELSRSGKPSRRMQRYEEQLAWFGRLLAKRDARA